MESFSINYVCKWCIYVICTYDKKSLISQVGELFLDGVNQQGRNSRGVPIIYTHYFIHFHIIRRRESMALLYDYYWIKYAYSLHTTLSMTTYYPIYFMIYVCRKIWRRRHTHHWIAFGPRANRHLCVYIIYNTICIWQKNI